MNINNSLIIKYYNYASIQKEMYLKFRKVLSFVKSPRCE